MSKDYLVTVKIRNNRILRAIEEAGGVMGQKWCEENGIGYARANWFVQLKSGPIDKNGNLYPDAERLCEVLGKLPEELWSNEQLYPLEKNFSDLEMDYAQVIAALPEQERAYLHDFSGIERAETKAIVCAAVTQLSPREQEVIHHRFYEDRSLQETGACIGITPERVRQIEAKALRKLRHMAGNDFVACDEIAIQRSEDHEARQRRWDQFWEIRGRK